MSRSWGPRASGLLDAVCVILNPDLNGILWICDSVGAVGISGIEGALAGLHGIVPLPSGFLHHDSLYNLYIFQDSILIGIPADHQSVIQHLLAFLQARFPRNVL